MATANVTPLATNGVDGPTRPYRRTTAHLKVVPESRETREQIRRAIRNRVVQLDGSTPLSKHHLEQISRSILREQNLGEGYVGWTMVCLTSEFWRPHIAQLPVHRRLLLLPIGLPHLDTCKGAALSLPPESSVCTACAIERVTKVARQAGYRILPAEGAAKVTRMLVNDEADAVIGFACLNVLERAMDKVLTAGIACMAIPMIRGESNLQLVDADWVSEMIESSSHSTTSVLRPPTYLHLMRAARTMFDLDQMQALVPRAHGSQRFLHGPDGQIGKLDPLAATEAVAYEFLVKGGKYSRPFITLAVHDALCGGYGTAPHGAEHLEKIPSAVKRAAIAIETFHKASLVHDDIEDDDEFRYGEPTLHRQLGIPTAINVGDYLIGMGYRLVARDQDQLGSRVTASILAAFAEAHHELSEGQGAELFWRDAGDKRLSPDEALRIYKLKTAPAFEAALIVGATLANQDTAYRELFRDFAHSIGIGFQILNDLKDWHRDDDNKLAVGADALGGRPTLLLALALEALDESDQQKLLDAISNHNVNDEVRLQQVRQLYDKANCFQMAQHMVDQQRRHAEQLAAKTTPEELRRLLYYLIDSVLEPGG